MKLIYKMIIGVFLFILGTGILITFGNGMKNVNEVGTGLAIVSFGFLVFLGILLMDGVGK